MMVHFIRKLFGLDGHQEEDRLQSEVAKERQIFEARKRRADDVMADLRRADDVIRGGSRGRQHG